MTRREPNPVATAGSSFGVSNDGWSVGDWSVFERDGAIVFVAKVDPRAGSIADLGETDGIDVTSAAPSPRFRSGLIIAQDGKACDGHQNFKFFAWDDLAGDRLRVGPPPPGPAPLSGNHPPSRVGRTCEAPHAVIR